MLCDVARARLPSLILKTQVPAVLNFNARKQATTIDVLSNSGARNNVFRFREYCRRNSGTRLTEMRIACSTVNRMLLRAETSWIARLARRRLRLLELVSRRQ